MSLVMGHQSSGLESGISPLGPLGPLGSTLSRCLALSIGTISLIRAHQLSATLPATGWAPCQLEPCREGASPGSKWVLIECDVWCV